MESHITRVNFATCLTLIFFTLLCLCYSHIILPHTVQNVPEDLGVKSCTIQVILSSSFPCVFNICCVHIISSASLGSQGKFGIAVNILQWLVDMLGWEISAASVFSWLLGKLPCFLLACGPGFGLSAHHIPCASRILQVQLGIVELDPVRESFQHQSLMPWIHHFITHETYFNFLYLSAKRLYNTF